MKKQVIFLPDAPKPLAKYSHGVKVGPFLFTAGIAAQAPGKDTVPPELIGDVAGQTRLILEHFKKILAAGGCTLNDVIRTNVYLTDMKDYQEMNKVYAEYFPMPNSECPGRMCMEISALATPELLVEIDMIAICPEND